MESLKVGMNTNYLELKDIDLVEIFRREPEHQQEVFEELVRRHQKTVIWVSYNVINNQEEALDISQEIFLRFYKLLFAPDWSLRETSIASWLSRATINLSIDYLRKYKPIYYEKEHFEELIYENQMNNLDDIEGKKIVDAILYILSEFEKAIFRLYFLENWSIKDIENLYKGPTRIYSANARIKKKAQIVYLYSVEALSIEEIAVTLKSEVEEIETLCMKVLEFLKKS